MKLCVKKILAKMLRMLPLTVQRALFNTLYAALQDLAKQFNITGFIADGEYGRIQGPIHDSTVFRYYAARGHWAGNMNQLFADFLNNGGTYLDIGANIGLTTIPIASNPSVTCHAFEPAPETFRLLSANVMSNCASKNVNIHNCALFDRESQLIFELSPDNGGDNRVRVKEADGDFNEHNWRTIEVRAARLDGMGLSISPPLVAKIDTQGAEPFVISGGIGVLASAELLAIEFWPYGMSRMDGDPKIVIDFIKQNFSSGQLSNGGSDTLTSWSPISDVAARLEAIVKEELEAHVYYDVMVRK